MSARLKLPMPARKQRQRGVIAVEAAFALPLMIGVGLLGSDLQRIGQERSLLEQASGSAAITLAIQSELTRKGVDALAEVLVKGNPDQYEIVMMNVMQSGRVTWGVRRGEAGRICSALSDGRYYTASLPEDKPQATAADDAETDNSSVSMLVVQVCRKTDDITLSGGLVLPDTISVTSINRANSLKIKIDAELTNESAASGLAQVTT
jgi:hypothetical protein